MENAAIDLFRSSLRAECDRLSLPLDDRLLDLLARHFELLASWNRRIRLVGSADPARAASELYADSLAACAFAVSFCGKAAPPAIVDIGSGAGFPGIPIKAARPLWPLSIIEPNAKKLSFLKNACRELGLWEVTFSSACAEALAHEPAWRERFDLAFCRAVTRPAAAIELAIPFVGIGGSFVLQAAEPDGQMLQSLAKAADALGATACESMAYDLPVVGSRRFLLRLKKLRPTPALYPRRLQVMRRQPLG